MNDFDNSRIRSVWIQTDQNSFDKIKDPINMDINLNPYKMAWIHFDKKPIEDPYINR